MDDDDDDGHDLSQTLKAGTLLIIETGEWSDGDWSGPVKLLRDFTKQELVDGFLREWVVPDGAHPDDTKPTEEDFLPWLIKTGRAEHVDNVQSWHVGSYGDFKP